MGLQATITDVLVRVQMGDGRDLTMLVKPSQAWIEIAATQGPWAVVGVYLRHGIQHICFGVDHLLFVLGLLLIVKDRWMLVKTVTAFTLAHSLTLAIATLGYAEAPLVPLNAAIALSILFLGPEIVRSWRGETSFTIRHPWVVAFLFGLLHGFGFAGALTSAGLPRQDLPLASSQLQCRGRDRPGRLCAADRGPRALLPAVGNPLAPLGGGIARIRGGITGGLLDHPEDGHPPGGGAMKNRLPSVGVSLPGLLLFVLSLAWPVTAGAHTPGGEALGFINGIQHPISGLDHIMAMIAVGLWGAQLGTPAVWLLPVTFPMVMALGGSLGLMGVPVPGIELGIALSAIALGLAVSCEARPQLWVAALLIGFFAIFHGHAHGTELPPGANGMLYSIGFVIATGTLHATGIGIGLVHRWSAGRIALRAAGALIALAGVIFLWRATLGGVWQ